MDNQTIITGIILLLATGFVLNASGILSFADIAGSEGKVDLECTSKQDCLNKFVPSETTKENFNNFWENSDIDCTGDTCIYTTDNIREKEVPANE